MNYSRAFIEKLKCFDSQLSCCCCCCSSLADLLLLSRARRVCVRVCVCVCTLSCAQSRPGEAQKKEDGESVCLLVLLAWSLRDVAACVLVAVGASLWASGWLSDSRDRDWVSSSAERAVCFAVLHIDIRPETLRRVWELMISRWATAKWKDAAHAILFS